MQIVSPAATQVDAGPLPLLLPLVPLLPLVVVLASLPLEPLASLPLEPVEPLAVPSVVPLGEPLLAPSEPDEGSSLHASASAEGAHDEEKRN